MHKGKRKLLTFVVAIGSLALGFVGGMLYERTGLDWPLSAVGLESIGERLQRECASVVDTAGVRVAPIDVITILKTDAANASELGPYWKRWEEFRTKYPDRWNEAVRTAIAQARDEMIRSCVLKKGTSP